MKVDWQGGSWCVKQNGKYRGVGGWGGVSDAMWFRSERDAKFWVTNNLVDKDVFYVFERASQ